MIRINQIKLPITACESELRDKVIKTLRINQADVINIQIVKKSLDARHKPDIFYIYSVNVTVKNESKINKRVFNGNVSVTTECRYKMPKCGDIKMKHRPVIVGMGPAGLFCAYYLAKRGFKPILIERGEAVEDRMKTVEAFFNGEKLNTKSNVQFGEGGAGTFSDGKLNTVVKDRDGKHREVMETFVKFGAKEEIIYSNKPHIGTDVLCNIVKNIRCELINMGADIMFNTCLTDIETENGEVKSITINNEKTIETDVLVLAIGHSARDTFEMLVKKNFDIEPKAFAVGVRCEHPQSMINEVMYGVKEHELLEAADYKVTYNTDKNRGVYSFCMCPGGYVVNASSEENRLCVNGMSYAKRDGKNANSAIIVTVTPDDFKNKGPLGGMYFQRELEEKAYAEGGGKIPVQTFKDFENNVKTTELKEVTPCIKGEYTYANLRNIFPEYISETIIEGMHGFAKKIKDFDREDAVFSGVEARTSSPIRIKRDEDFVSSIKGIYPCGEGAGYAGGITSACMDGMRIFEAITKKYSI